MIKLFRSQNPFNLILLAVIAIILRVGILYEMPARLSFDFIEPFTKLLVPIPLENAFSPLVNIFIALFLMLIQAFIFNKVINDYTLLSKPTFLPALMYVTIGSLLKPFLVLSPPLICNFLVIWMIEKFLSVYRRDDMRSVMFDLGIIVAFGTLIYFPFIAMLPLLWIGLTIFRPFNLREWIIGLVGFLTIFFFLGVFYYWNNSLDNFYKIWLPLATKFPVNLNINLYNYLVLMPVAIVFLLGILQLRNNFFRSFVQVRKSFQLLFFMFLLGLVSFYLKPDFQMHHFLLCVPPASVLMTYYFLNAEKRWIYESLYLLLTGFIIYFQLF